MIALRTSSICNTFAQRSPSSSRARQRETSERTTTHTEERQHHPRCEVFRSRVRNVKDCARARGARCRFVRRAVPWDDFHSYGCRAHGARDGRDGRDGRDISTRASVVGGSGRNNARGVRGRARRSRDETARADAASVRERDVGRR